jgi:hypothetical protein
MTSPHDISRIPERDGGWPGALHALQQVQVGSWVTPRCSSDVPSLPGPYEVSSKSTPSPLKMLKSAGIGIAEGFFREPVELGRRLI